MARNQKSLLLVASVAVLAAFVGSAAFVQFGAPARTSNTASHRKAQLQFDSAATEASSNTDFASFPLMQVALGAICGLVVAVATAAPAQADGGIRNSGVPGVSSERFAAQRWKEPSEFKNLKMPDEKRVKMVSEANYENEDGTIMEEYPEQEKVITRKN
eukprot:TRINITY_DN1486_c0_g1_i10.p1 TRINITY_DN1486_c0_g1~~TRINITY_DN1486_c0_g1_i10.p1  ORF type:complete len:159 (-),score=39.10 TRINITY_DN1486_c0_g1_i10:11-487(-)